MAVQVVPPANYTTSVPVTRTVSEVADMLARRGASEVQTRFAEGVPAGLSFAVDTLQGVRAYRLPVQIEAMFGLLGRCAAAGVLGSRAESQRRSSVEHARRVAWRVVRDWVRAQLTLIDAEMASMDTVFLPYMLTPAGETVAEVFERRDLQLGGGEA